MGRTAKDLPALDDRSISLGQMGQRAMSNCMTRLGEARSQISRLEKQGKRGLRQFFSRKMRSEALELDSAIQELHNGIQLAFATYNPGEYCPLCQMGRLSHVGIEHLNTRGTYDAFTEVLEGIHLSLIAELYALDKRKTKDRSEGFERLISSVEKLKTKVNGILEPLLEMGKTPPTKSQGDQKGLGPSRQ